MITLSLNDILAIARKEIDSPHDAALFNGTLLCRCSYAQACRIQTAIEESSDIQVQMFRELGDEYVFVFVA